MDKALVTNSSKIYENPLKKMFSLRHNDKQICLETLVDLEEQFKRLSQNKLEMISPEIIYKKGNLFSKSVIFLHYSEREISCTHEDQTEFLNLLSEE